MIPVQRLRALSPFRDASTGVLSALAAAAVEIRFAAEEVLFVAGESPRGWYVVLEGTVRVVRGTGTRQHVVHTEEAGGTLGEVPLFAGGTHPATGIATTPTVCALFRRNALIAAMAVEPGAALLLLQRLALRVRGLVDRLDDRSVRGVRARLAEYLLLRQAASRPPAFSLGLTQEALAQELGTVREVLSRELASLRDEGVIVSRGGGRYGILDSAALGRAAERV
ncbi:MAG TPA: Crp/Fnr family transcriptional regulator [Gemmatimonadales bacterium]|nr:Crp/Fnr family transcriptional regulator [Gemmatimonadales bacterium]